MKKLILISALIAFGMTATVTTFAKEKTPGVNKEKQTIRGRIMSVQKNQLNVKLKGSQKINGKQLVTVPVIITSKTIFLKGKSRIAFKDIKAKMGCLIKYKLSGKKIYAVTVEVFGGNAKKARRRKKK